MSDCLFCRIIEGEIPSRKVYENDAVYAIEDIHPQAPTHVLILPRIHRDSVNDLRPEDGPLCEALFSAAREIARQRGISDKGYRLILNVGKGAGQSVFHLHMHLLGGRAFSEGLVT